MPCTSHCGHKAGHANDSMANMLPQSNHAVSCQILKKHMANLNQDPEAFLGHARTPTPSCRLLMLLGKYTVCYTV
jgi:hypothetical protein